MSPTYRCRRNAQRERSRFSSSENKRMSATWRKRREREIANGTVCFGYPIGGQDFQERIINFPCHSGGPLPTPFDPPHANPLDHDDNIAGHFVRQCPGASVASPPPGSAERGDFANKQPEPIPPSSPSHFPSPLIPRCRASRGTYQPVNISPCN